MFVIDLYLGLLDWLSLIWTKVKLFSIMLWLVYDCVKIFFDLKLKLIITLVVCSISNLIELYYSLAYKEHFL